MLPAVLKQFTPPFRWRAENESDSKRTFVAAVVDRTIIAEKKKSLAEIERSKNYL